MIRGWVSVGAVVVACLVAARAEAGISSTGSAITERGVPTSAEMGVNNTLNDDEINSDTTIFIWLEGIYTLASATSIESTPLGNSAGVFNSNADRVIGTLPAGLEGVESYFIHFDAVTNSGAGTTINSNASITFTAPIVGLFINGNPVNVGEPSISGSNATFQPSGVAYNVSGLGLELGSGAGRDIFTVSADRLTLTINTWTVLGGADNLRVLVNPEPATAGLFVLGLAGFGGLVWRRRRARALQRAN